MSKSKDPAQDSLIAKLKLADADISKTAMVLQGLAAIVGSSIVRAEEKPDGTPMSLAALIGFICDGAHTCQLLADDIKDTIGKLDDQPNIRF